MQILVVSDTHGAYDVLRTIIRSHPAPELVIHCGDGEEDVAQYRREFPEDARRILMVRGNCDQNSEIPEMLIQPLPYGHKLLAVHCHRYMYGDLQEILAALGRENGADIVVYGHLHTRVESVVNGIHLFNPGSAALPRDGKKPSYGRIDIFDSGVLFSFGQVGPTLYDTHPSEYL